MHTSFLCKNRCSLFLPPKNVSTLQEFYWELISSEPPAHNVILSVSLTASFVRQAVHCILVFITSQGSHTDTLHLSGLIPGMYAVQLTVTDTYGHRSSAVANVVVLQGL